MTLQELTQLVLLGEGLGIEFKHKVPQPARIAKEAVAFANTHGGRLLLGVGDDGTISGLKDAEEEEYALRLALNTHCRPPLEFTTDRVSVTAKREVIVVLVPESRTKPHFVVDEDEKSQVAYVRINDMSVEASKEAVRLMRHEQNERDVLFQFGEKEQLLMRYLERYGHVTVAQFAAMANIPEKLASHTLVLLTRAGLLQLHLDTRADYFTLAYGQS